MFITIGLEVHLRLNTRSKLFSFSLVKPNTLMQNIYVNTIDLAFPGVLPNLNKRAILLAVKFGISINAVINAVCLFDRKHYRYPDLPKGYQITQFKYPILKLGHIDITLPSSLRKRVFLKDAHLEEDTGKLHHDYSLYKSFIDFNRCGFPLLEVVTEPILNTAKEAYLFLEKLYALVTTLGFCNPRMETGSFRCDVNWPHCRIFYLYGLGRRTGVRCISKFFQIQSYGFHPGKV